MVQSWFAVKCTVNPSYRTITGYFSGQFNLFCFGFLALDLGAKALLRAKRWGFTSRLHTWRWGNPLEMPGDTGNFHICIPSGYVKIAIENGHRNSGFKNGDFP